MLFKTLTEQFLMFVVNQKSRPPLVIFVLGKKGEERDQLFSSQVQFSLWEILYQFLIRNIRNGFIDFSEFVKMLTSEDGNSP